MTLEDTPPLTRRALREDASSAPAADDDLDAIAALADAAARPPAAPAALGWVDAEKLGPLRTPVTGEPDLLARRPRRSPFRATVLMPIAAVIALVGGYAGATLLWPLTAVAPTIEAADITPVAAPASTLTWPEAGSAAAAVDGMSNLASTTEASPIASITKVVTVLMALEQLPLAVGEQGPDFAFTYSDRAEYWDYLARGESALDVPVDGTLTQYELLQGILLGSAGNYAQRLADELWPNDEVFATAASAWLERHGLTGITIVEPTGILEANAADPAALLALADLALADPVVAEIVRTRSADLPGAGEIENTNDLLADPSVLGVKTGGLWEWYNLLSAKEVTVDDTTVRLYASVLGQPTDALRDGESARLLDALAAEVSRPAVLSADTVAGTVTTLWGESAEIVTDAEGSIVLWNGGVAEIEPSFALDESRSAGDVVGTLVFAGPLDSDTLELRLADDIEPPDAWWRLTHPLQLFGLAD